MNEDSEFNRCLEKSKVLGERQKKEGRGCSDLTMPGMNVTDFVGRANGKCALRFRQFSSAASAARTGDLADVRECLASDGAQEAGLCFSPWASRHEEKALRSVTHFLNFPHFHSHETWTPAQSNLPTGPHCMDRALRL